MKIIIRKAEERDVSGILRLVKELATFEREPLAVINTEERMLSDGFGKNPSFISFVAEADNEMAGMAVFYFAYSTWKGRYIYLDDIIVTEKFRKHGVGKLLFDKIIEFAKENNANQLRWHVLNWNEPAIHFYEKYKADMDPDWITCKLEKEFL